MAVKDEYVGKLLYDARWGLGLITKKIRHDSYQIWWYTPANDWYGEVDRIFIIKFNAHKYVHDNYVLKKNMP